LYGTAKVTKKEIYNLALQSTQESLRAYFEDTLGFKNEYLQKQPNGKKIVKKVYDRLEKILLTSEDTK
jgi:hypothetical protein